MKHAPRIVLWLSVLACIVALMGMQSCIATQGDLQARDKARIVTDGNIAAHTTRFVAGAETADEYVANVKNESTTAAASPPPSKVPSAFWDMALAALAVFVPGGAGVAAALNAYRNSTSAQRTANELAKSSVGSLPSPNIGLPPAAAVPTGSTVATPAGARTVGATNPFAGQLGQTP